MEWIKVGGSDWLTDLVGLGALTSLVPRHVLDKAIELHGCREERVLMALCLFADDDYEEVAEKLTGLLAAMPGSPWEPPTRGAVTQARQRLGTEVVREVFERGFYSFSAWRYVSSTGAQLLWRVQAGLHPYWLKDVEDGSWLAVITKPTKLRRDQKDRLRQDARLGRDLDPDQAVIVRVVDHTVPDRKGDHIRLITTILDPAEATAQQLAACYHERIGRPGPTDSGLTAAAPPRGGHWR